MFDLDYLRQYASPSQTCFYRENVSRKARVAARSLAPLGVPHPAAVAGWVTGEQREDYLSQRTVDFARALRAKYGHES